MARLPRYYLAKYPQHIIVRAIEPLTLFSDDEDANCYLRHLHHSANKHHCDLHAYALMPNHVHLLLTPQLEQGIGKVLQRTSRYYVQHFNQRYQHHGSIWQGRYRATLVDDEHYGLSCMRYIEYNPVRAGLVEDPAAYPWSSYGANGLGEHSDLISECDAYLKLGASHKHRAERYRQICTYPLSETELQAIRDNTNKAWVLGSDEFKERIAGHINRRTDPKPRGGDHRSALYQQQRQQQTHGFNASTSRSP